MSALSKFKLKKDLTKSIEKEEKGGGADSRFLPYYNLKTGEKMKVLIVPDTNGELFAKYSTHGPNLKVRGTGAIGCLYKNHKEDCPACHKGFELLDQHKATGDESYKTEAKRWFAKDTTIMSVIVLDSPIEFPAADDGNEVKLMYVPYAVEQLIKNSLMEGQIDQDELTSTPLWIKKTENKGGQAAYDTSFFDRSPITDEELGFFESDDIVVEPFDYSKLDVIPEHASEEEVVEWLEKAEELVEKHKASSGGTKTPQKKTTSLADRLGKKKKEEAEPEEEQEDDTPDEPEQEETKPEKTENKPVSKASSLRERLAASKNRK